MRRVLGDRHHVDPDHRAFLGDGVGDRRRRSWPPRARFLRLQHVAGIAEGDADIAIGEIVDVFRGMELAHVGPDRRHHRGRALADPRRRGSADRGRDRRAPPGKSPARCPRARCRSAASFLALAGSNSSFRLSVGAPSPSAAFDLGRVVADAGRAPHIGHAVLVAGIGLGGRRQDLRIEIAVIARASSCRAADRRPAAIWRAR